MVWNTRPREAYLSLQLTECQEKLEEAARDRDWLIKDATRAREDANAATARAEAAEAAFAKEKTSARAF